MSRIVTLIVIVPLIISAAEWQSLDGPPAGRADDITIGWHPIESYWVIYAADNTHKLYKSVNEGEYWDSLTYFDVTRNPKCVITRPNDAQIVYLGKDDDVPVWWSEDAGQTWDERSGEYPNNITNTKPLCFAMDPNDANKIYLGCDYNGQKPEMFKTTNAGEDWQSLDNAPEAYVNDIAITHYGTLILAGCSKTADCGIWLSTDSGNNWSQKLSDVNIHSLDFASQDTGYAGSDSFGVYKTTDGGDNWVLLSNSPERQISDLEAITSNTVYAATGPVMGKPIGGAAAGGGMFVTTDGGATWTEINEGIYARYLRCLITHPVNSQVLFAGGVHSVYKTTNSGNNWYEIIKGFKILNFKSDQISIHSQ